MLTTDKRMIALALKTKTTVNETGAFSSLRNVVIVMRLSIQLILWNAVWRKFLVSSSVTLSAELKTLPHKNRPRIKPPYIPKTNYPGVILIPSGPPCIPWTTGNL